MAAKPDRDNRVSVSGCDFPRAQIGKASIEAAVKAVDYVVTRAEKAGFPFTSDEKQGCGGFLCGNAHCQLRLEEPLERVTHEPTDEEKRRPSWEWSKESRAPSGKLLLHFAVNSYPYSTNRRRTWPVAPDEPTEETATDIAEILTDIREKDAKAKSDEAERHKKWEEERRLDEERRRREKHESELDTIESQRAENLLHAAEWWRLHTTAMEFIEACERRWREQGEISGEQSAWLDWARSNAAALSPIEGGYPDPARDGKLDRRSIPLGKPGPSVDKIPRPPSFTSPDKPSENPYSHTTFTQTPAPYPFWLKHGRRR